MISKDAVEILMNLIKQINENTKKCGTCFPNSGHLLVQVSILLEEIRYVKLVFMLPSTSYLPGGCHRSQVAVMCSQVARLGCLALGIKGRYHCPTSHHFPQKSYSMAFSWSSCPYSLRTSISTTLHRKQAWKNEKAARLCKTTACQNQNFNRQSFNFQSFEERPHLEIVRDDAQLIS